MVVEKRRREGKACFFLACCNACAEGECEKVELESMVRCAYSR